MVFKIMRMYYDVPPTTIVIDQLLYGPAPIPDEPTIAPIPFDEESGE